MPFLFGERPWRQGHDWLVKAHVRDFMGDDHLLGYHAATP
jgi:hypothetical protein